MVGSAEAEHPWRGRLQALLALCLFGAALVILRRELRHFRYADLVSAMHALGAGRVRVALVLTSLNYFVLTGYDTLSLRILRHRLAYRRIVLTSFIAYAFAHNVGLAFLGGSAVRFRLYSTWGLATDQIASVLFLNLITFWLGFALLTGLTLVLAPPVLPGELWLPVSVGPALGGLCLLLLLGYLVLVLLRRTPLSIRGREFSLPSPPLAVAQIVLSAMDWLLAAAVLYTLLPLGGMPFAHFVGIFLCAQIAGLASNVPAGLGVFESVILLFVGAQVSHAGVLGGLLAYRAIYNLLPLMAGVALLVGHEVTQRAHVVRRLGRTLDRLAPTLVPQALALTTFAGGVVLLVSGATPAEVERLGPLGSLLGLPVIEMSHFAGSVLGVGLLLLARGLQLRLDAAYLLTCALLAGGVVASLLKGFDYEEAVILSVLLAVLLPCRRHFYRRASLLDEPLTRSWIVAVALVILGTGWLMALSYRHVEYEHYLWWQFELSADAPRSLRAAAGVLGALAVYGAARLLHPAKPEPHAPTPDELAAVDAVVAASPITPAKLALLGDKRFLLNAQQTAFVMYATFGRSWIAMGDPVGPPAECRELAWEFYELADRHAGWPVFYEVAETNLSLYLELGLGLIKLGEEARVALPTFSLEGGTRKTLRQNHTRFQREGCSVEIVPAGQVTPLLPELRRVSDEWLQAKATREKSFSLGSFVPEYLMRLPIAVVRRHERMIAFANLWLGAQQEEVAVDLMRYANDAPPAVMDYLFCDLMLWAKAQGFRWFSLGMAPLSGLEQRALAPLWSRLGAFVFRHGESFYNFKGLRQYKSKFGPEWTPRYLASPGGVALPLVAANLASLVSGGFRGVVTK